MLLWEITALHSKNHIKHKSVDQIQMQTFLIGGEKKKVWEKIYRQNSKIEILYPMDFLPYFLVFTVITQKILNALNCFAMHTFPNLSKTILQSFHFTSSYKTEYWKETS